MIRRINPGNALPIYPDVMDQYRFRAFCNDMPFGLKAPKGMFTPFQFFFNGIVSVGAARVWNASTGQVEVDWVSSGVFTVDYLSGGTSAYLTFNHDSFLSLFGSLCGFYYLEVKINSTTYFTEVVDTRVIKNSSGRFYEIRFKDHKDTENVLYQNGYEQKLVFEGYFSEPAMDVNEEKTINGYNDEFLNFRSAKERQRLDLKDIPGYLVSAMYELENRDVVILRDIATGYESRLKEVQFSVRPQDDCFAVGQLSFATTNEVKTKCEENKVLA